MLSKFLSSVEVIDVTLEVLVVALEVMVMYEVATLSELDTFLSIQSACFFW